MSIDIHEPVRHEHDHPTPAFRLKRWLKRFKHRRIIMGRYLSVSVPKNLLQYDPHGRKFRIYCDGTVRWGDMHHHTSPVLADVLKEEVYPHAFLVECKGDLPQKKEIEK